MWKMILYFMSMGLLLYFILFIYPSHLIKSIKKKVTFGIVYPLTDATWPASIKVKGCNANYIFGEIIIIDENALEANTISLNPLTIEFKYPERNEVKKWWKIGSVNGIPVSLDGSTVTIRLKRSPHV